MIVSLQFLSIVAVNPKSVAAISCGNDNYDCCCMHDEKRILQHCLSNNCATQRTLLTQQLVFPVAIHLHDVISTNMSTAPVPHVAALCWQLLRPATIQWNQTAEHIAFTAVLFKPSLATPDQAMQQSIGFRHPSATTEAAYICAHLVAAFGIQPCCFSWQDQQQMQHDVDQLKSLLRIRMTCHGAGATGASMAAASCFGMFCPIGCQTFLAAYLTGPQQWRRSLHHQMIEPGLVTHHMGQHGAEHQALQSPAHVDGSLNANSTQ
jgi:hypothetical protein